MNDPAYGINGSRERGPLILLIDDDREFASLMERFLTTNGFRFKEAHDGVRGLAAFDASAPDLVLLDGMLPGLDGIEVIRAIRGRRAETPVLMLTARVDKRSRIDGLDSGADDYVAKPFDPDELLARIRAMLRRGRLTGGVLEASGVRLVPSAQSAEVDGKPLSLTNAEFSILSELVRRAGETVDRDRLSVALNGGPALPFDRAIDVHISHLRRKLTTRGDLIHTIRGVGYLFRVEERPG